MVRHRKILSEQKGNDKNGSIQAYAILMMSAIAHQAFSDRLM